MKSASEPPTPPPRPGMRQRRRRGHQLLLVVLVVLFGLTAAATTGCETTDHERQHAGESPRSSADGATRDPAAAVRSGRVVAGSRPLGATSYSFPLTTLFVSVNGNDASTGSQESPFRSIRAAIKHARDGATVVIRRGNYHEYIIIPPNKRLTIQSFPGEPVWIDGSSRIRGWTHSNRGWYVNNWNYHFDSSPTFKRGAPDGTTPGWQWINSGHPMAAHPDQLWINGIPLNQVGELSKLTWGSFYVDNQRRRLYLGRDPTGSTVEASTLTQALSIRSPGSVIRGIGIRRYANSVWMMGAVTIDAPSVTLNNVIISDNATTGLYVMGINAQIVDVTAGGNGLMGVGANYADGLRVTGLLTIGNNRERFNSAPVSGGLKVTRSREVAISDSVFAQNYGPGVWLDESVVDARVVGSDMLDNSGHGVVMELSERIKFTNNLLLRNLGNGVKIANSGEISLWYNTILGSDRPVNVVQDGRHPANLLTPGHDPRELADPPPWISRNITFGNGVIGESTGNCVFCVEDLSHQYSADDLDITISGTVLQRTSYRSPRWLIVWSRGNGDPEVFTSLKDFIDQTDAATRSLSVDGRRVTTDSGRLRPDMLSAVDKVAVVPPPTIRIAIAGRVTGVGAQFSAAAPPEPGR